MKKFAAFLSRDYRSSAPRESVRIQIELTKTASALKGGKSVSRHSIRSEIARFQRQLESEEAIAVRNDPR
jgi:hypothetical protein